MTNNTHSALTNVEVILSWGDSHIAQKLAPAKDATFTVGERGKDFALPSEVTGGDFTLVERGVLHVPANAVARQNGAPLAAGVHPLAAGTTTVRLGDFTFTVRGADAIEKVGPAKLDLGPLKYIAAAGAVAGLFLGMFMLAPPSAAALAGNDIERATRYIPVALDSVLSPEEMAQLDYGYADPAQGGDVASPEAGAQGVEGAPEDGGGEMQAQGRAPRSFVRPAATADDAISSMVNALGVFAAGASDSPSPFDAARTEGWSTRNVYGPGAEPPAGNGNGGLDMTGPGRGQCTGARCADGTVASGDFDIPGGHDGDGRDPGPPGELPGREPRTVGPTLRIPPATTSGGLTPTQIRRVVRQNVGQVRHCYEQALLGRPDLEGRIAVRFLVDADGEVIGSTVLSDDVGGSVASCVAQQVRTWSFPAANGLTQANYPFVFTAAD